MANTTSALGTDLALHVIAVDRDGLPLQVDGSRRVMSENEFQAHISRVLAALETAVRDRKKILLYVHGGRNAYRASLAQAGKIAEKLPAEYHPIFLNWHTGDLNCYLDHLFRIRAGRIHRSYWWITWLWLLIGDLGRALTNFPASLYLQIINDCKPFLPHMNPEGATSSALYERVRERRHVGIQNPAISIGEDRRSRMERWTSLCLLIITYPVKAALSSVIYAVGASLWSNMVRRSKTAFRSAAEFDVRDFVADQKKLDSALDQNATGAFGLFGAALQSRICALRRDLEIQITMVGHSMGSMILNEIMRTFPDLSAQTVVFMGAACSINEFIDYTIPYLQRHTECEFANLCLHPVAEQSEAALAGMAPGGSLLVWIDNFLSNPGTIPDRTLGMWENVLQVTHLIPHDVRSRIHIKAFGAGRRAGGPQKHGDFDEESFWEHDFWRVA